LAQAPALRVAEPINQSQLAALKGNVQPLARTGIDMGAVSANLRLQRLLLVLSPSTAQQAALDALVEAQQDPNSPYYHQWLTPGEFGAEFGANDTQLAQVTAWLTTHGFSIDGISPGRRLVQFSGTAGQVSGAFHAEIHYYRVSGAMHIAGAQVPQIPGELAGLVKGVVSLHDFRRISQISSQKALAAQPQYSAGATHSIFPADFATIYDLNPLYDAGTNGAGAAIAVAGRSNINLSDVAAFRSIAGLAANAPTVIVDGADPGIVSSDQSESTLDVEWSGAVAPEAAVTLVVAASTATTDGVDLASAYIVDHATAPVMSMSYANCEQDMSATELAFYNNLWEQAASEGMSVFVSSGDTGAAGCQQATAGEGTSAAVNGMCSSPYATCVGGTEFNDGANAAEYWSPSNSPAYGSALGYIPEEVWNESALDGGVGLWASGGGRSTVYRQPAWQQGVSGTSTAGGMRAVPDVSLATAYHDGYLVVENGGHQVVSGTSLSAPAFAGVMALVTQKDDGKGQGSVNARLYALSGAVPDPFHPTPQGNNSVPGVAGFTANGAAYNLATGLGSVDGVLLVDEWNMTSTVAPPTLTLTAATQTATITPGSPTTIQFTALTGGSFTGSVSFSISGLPSGVTAIWLTDLLTPSSGAGTNNVELRLITALGTTSGSANIVVTATGDGLTATQTITATVTARVNGCARFSLLPTSCRPLSRMPML
jgi:subtilase family serine protease